MIQKLRIRAIGSSLGTILPKNMLERLCISRDDEIYAIETEDGILLTPHDPHCDSAMEAFEIGRKQYRNALRKLAE